MKTCPLVEGAMHPSIVSKVDLPDPDGPMIVINSPLLTLKFTPFNASTSAGVSSKNFLHKSLISMIRSLKS